MDKKISARLRGEEFEGDASQLRDSDWICAFDLEAAGGTATLTIDSIRSDAPTFEGGEKKKVFFLAFKETSRGLIINATNLKTLMRAFGVKKPSRNWVGKKIELYIEENVRNPKGGPPVRGVRIRIPKENKGEPGQAQPEGPETLSFS